MWGSIRRCTAHKQFRLKVRQRRPKSCEKAVAFASEVEAMEQTEYCKHTRAVHVNNPPEVLTVNNDETNQILKRSHYIIEQNKPSFERIKRRIFSMSRNSRSKPMTSLSTNFSTNMAAIKERSSFCST